MTDIRNDAYIARAAIVEAAAFMSAPHVRMRPRVYPDGDQWCCLYGDDPQVGVAGFGDTPEQACMAFDRAWSTERAPKMVAPAQAKDSGPWWCECGESVAGKFAPCPKCGPVKDPTGHVPF